MVTSKVTYNPKTREDFSNPYNKFSYEELRKLAHVEMFNGDFEIEKLPDGRIRVKKKNKSKQKK